MKAATSSLTARYGCVQRPAMGRRAAVAPRASAAIDSAKLFQELDESIDAFRRAPPSMVRAFRLCVVDVNIGWLGGGVGDVGGGGANALRCHHMHA